MDDKETDAFKKFGAFATVPFVLAVPPILGWWIGSWLDKKLDLAPYLMYLLVILGVIAGIREFLRILRTFGNDV